ncbi:YhfH family protein [Cytobacillus depressus]|uniref:YhfH family protein n=1 Tax=Cytobacillus depressus TaxID=1602942 RepID=A0A6L3V643_9BACI|nr:protein YhfH [Cytobacillus depressus]KAB2330209.1 YhfH family protein [Cytobacillus depressus]
MLKGRESLKVMPKRICAECGQKMNEHTESYLMECDRCLSKKSE